MNVSSWLMCGLFMIGNCAKRSSLLVHYKQIPKWLLCFHSISRRIPERVDDTDENIIACAIDGAAAMVGKYRGFTAF